MIAETYRISAPGWNDDGTYYRTSEGVIFQDDAGALSLVSYSAVRRGRRRGREPLEERIAADIRRSSSYKTYARLFPVASSYALDRTIEATMMHTQEAFAAVPEPVSRTPAYLAATIPEQAPTARYELYDTRTSERVSDRTLTTYARLAHGGTAEQAAVLAFMANTEFRPDGEKPGLLTRLKTRIRGLFRRTDSLETTLLERSSQVLSLAKEDLGARAVAFYNGHTARYGGAKYLLYEAGAHALGLFDGESYRELLQSYLWTNRETTRLKRFDINLVSMPRHEFTAYVRSAYESEGLTLKEVAQAIERDTGMRVSVSTISRIARKAINKERAAKGLAAVRNRRQAQAEKAQRRAKPQQAL